MHTDPRPAVPAAPDVSAEMNARAGRQQFWAWLALVCAVGLVVTIYVALSLAVSADPLLMPLDDTYIHFQYARQAARGDFMVYNPGDPATSGGTSLLYPLLLAAGYALGFQGWALAYWALGLGALALFGCAWLVYLIALHNPLIPDRQPGYALWLALAFAVSGPVVWAALSGMETLAFLFATLLALYSFQTHRLRRMLAAGVLMVLLRPEGVVLAGLASLAWALRDPWPPTWGARIRQAAWLGVPLLAGLVQPMVNLLVTGSASSSGMQAKSHLYNTGAPLAERLEAILEFFIRMWRELLVGRSPDMGTYTSPLLAVLALAGLIVGVLLAWRQRRINSAALVLAWIVALTAGVATLDTAFWQFKRYQLPAMALFFPAAAWVAALLGNLLERRTGVRWARWGLPALILVPALLTTITFVRSYGANVQVVRDQQVPMARWVAEHLPDDARIGVHDVGLMRYFGDRALYDVVGLTTPDAAAAWRQGPGAIYETMAASPYRPGYFAIYPDVQGLRYLLDAGVMGEVLAEFALDLPAHNVAAATGYQAVYRADWSDTRAQEQIAQATTLDWVEGLELVDWVDVADLESEAAHAYEWWPDEPSPGFASEVYRHAYHACGRDEDGCWATDGGRVITGGESFTLETMPGQDLLLVTRVHGRASVPLMITVNGKQQPDRVQPAVPGRWLEVVSWVPGEQITRRVTTVRIEPQIVDPVVDAYMPYAHWAYQGAFEPEQPPASETEPLATFGAGGAVRLLRYNLTTQPDQFTVELAWLGPAPGAGDAITFVHLYNNTEAEPVTQVVARPAGGVLPPGNWLPGVVRDVYTVALPDDLARGTYAVAIGLYDPRSGQRLPVHGPGADESGRLFIGEVTIQELAQ